METKEIVKAYNDGYVDGTNDTLNEFMRKLRGVFEGDENAIEQIEKTLTEYIDERNGATNKE